MNHKFCTLEEFVDRGEEYYEECYRERVLHHLTKRAEKLDMKLTPAQGSE